jgi:hypothetical protein
MYRGYDSHRDIPILASYTMPNTARFVSHVRDHVGSATILATLSTDLGTIEWLSSTLSGSTWTTVLRFKFAGIVSQGWTASSVVFDVARIDAPPNQYLGFIVTEPVIQTVTRLA